jgi:hypothetical protein
MLSKVEKLLQSYTDYSFTSNLELIESLRFASADAELWMKKFIGINYYDSIKAKNNVDLTDGEQVLVRAEIYAIASYFLYLYETTSNSSQSFSQASVADVSIGGAGKSTGTEKSYKNYYQKACDYLMMVGVDTTKTVSRTIQSNGLSSVTYSNAYEGVDIPWPKEYR